MEQRAQWSAPTWAACCALYSISWKTFHIPSLYKINNSCRSEFQFSTKCKNEFSFGQIFVGIVWPNIRPKLVLKKFEGIKINMNIFISAEHSVKCRIFSIFTEYQVFGRIFIFQRIFSNFEAPNIHIRPKQKMPFRFNAATK